MILSKEVFIPLYIKVMEKRLYENLRQEGFEGQMVADADRIVLENSRHIQNALRDP
jgi:hypothetical protein